jgi:hypothetical protein
MDSWQRVETTPEIFFSRQNEDAIASLLRQIFKKVFKAIQ